MAARTGVLLWVAHSAGPIAFGKFALCVSTTELLRIASDFGTQTLFVRRFARAIEPGSERQELIALVRFRGVATVIGLVLYFALVSMIFDGRIGSLEILSSGLLVTALASSLPLTFYQAKLETHKAVAPVIGSALAYLAFCVVFRHSSIFVLIVGLLGYEALTALVLSFMVMSEAEVPLRAFILDKGALSLKDTARASLPIMSGSLISTVYTRVDVYAVKAISGVVALGLYSYAFRLTEPFRYLGLSIESSIYSHLSAKLSTGAVRSPNLKLVEKLVFAYSALFAVLAYGTGRVITALLYPEYTATAVTIFILSTALFFRCVNGYQTALQNALGRFNLTARFSLIGLVVTGLFIFPLTKYFGFSGAALTLLIMELVNFGVQRHFYKLVAGPIKKGLA